MSPSVTASAVPAGTSGDSAAASALPSYDTPSPVPPLRVHPEPEIYICYVRQRLSRGSYVDTGLHQIRDTDLVSSGASYIGGTIFFRTLLSFATTIFGTVHNDPLVLNQGFAAYGIALQQLNQALKEPQCYRRNDVLMSVAVLALQESVAPSSPRANLRHMQGLERLLELRGPTACCAEPRIFQIYKGVRAMQLMASLRTGRASIFAEPEWKATVRAALSPDEMPLQALFDVLADCSKLMAERKSLLQAHSLATASDASVDALVELRRKAEELLNRLYAWRQQRENKPQCSLAHSPAPSPEQMGLPRQPQSEDPPTPQTNAIKSSAVVFMLYNITIIYVLRLIIVLDSDSPTSNQSAKLQHTLHDSNADYATIETKAAHEIRNCFPRYLGQTAQTGPSPIGHWAFVTAWTTLGSSRSEEGRDLMRLLGNSIGQLTIKFIDTFSDD